MVDQEDVGNVAGEILLKSKKTLIRTTIHISFEGCTHVRAIT